MATGPLVRVISGLTGAHDPALARLTREARYETPAGLDAGTLGAGRPVVLVASFSA